MSAAELGTGKSSPARGGWATHAGLLVVQFAFASQTVEAKIVMLPRALGGEEIFPEALAMIRMLGGAVFFQVLALAHASHDAGPKRPATQGVAIRRADHARLAALSVLGISLNQALFLMGLRWTTPFSSAVLGATIPVFAAALAVILGKERFAWKTVLGLSLALVGVATLIGSGSLDRGALLVALNCLSYAAYVVLSRDVVVRVGALRTVAWVFTYGAIAFAPFGLFPMIGQIPGLTPRGCGYLAYILAVPTIVAYLVNAWALGRSSATLVTVYIYLQPLISAVLGWAQLGLGISRRAGLAAVLILLGLGVVVSRKPRGT